MNNFLNINLITEPSIESIYSLLRNSKSDKLNSIPSNNTSLGVDSYFVIYRFILFISVLSLLMNDYYLNIRILVALLYSVIFTANTTTAFNRRPFR